MDERVGKHGRRGEAPPRRKGAAGVYDRDGSGDGLDLMLLWQGVLRRRALIGYAVLAGLALATAYLFTATPRYSATASLLLDAPQPKILSVESVILGRESDQYFVESQLEILQSPRILRAVLDLLPSRDLIPRPEPESKAAGAVAALGAAQTDATPEKVATVYAPEQMDMLKRNLKVERKGRSFLIELTYMDKDPKRAAGIANAFVDAYIADQLETKLQATRSVNGWLKDRLDELRHDLEQAEWRIQNFRVEKDLVDIGEMTLAQKQISDHALALANARAREAEAEARLSQVHTQTNELERDTLTDQVKLLEEGLERLKQKMLNGNAQLIKLDELKREAEASRALYLTLLTRYKETYAQEKLVGADARPLAYAVAPERPSHPKSLLILAAAFVGSLGLGIGAALVRELTEKTFHSEAEVERVLNVPCIASIATADLTEGGNGNPIKTALTGKSIWTGDDNRRGPFHQSIFAVMRWINALSSDRPRVVTFVSANNGDGRSLLASQLARMAARSGVSTLLVDADLRSAGLTRALDIEPDPGPFASDEPSSFIFDESRYGFDFCPSAMSSTRDPIDLLNSKFFEAFFLKARDRYDLIVIDTPALSDWVDARTVLDIADIAVVVLKADKTSHEEAVSLIRKVSASGVTAAGIVLNAIPGGQRSLQHRFWERLGMVRKASTAGASAAGVAQKFRHGLGKRWKRQRKEEPETDMV